MATQTIAINVAEKYVDYRSTVWGWPKQTLWGKAPSCQMMSLLGPRRLMNESARSDNEIKKSALSLALTGSVQAAEIEVSI